MSGAISSADSRSHPRHDDDDDDDHHDRHNGRHPWATHALLFLSFDDGMLLNVTAWSFLRCSLADALLHERIVVIEDGIRSLAEFSPCNGPRTDAINDMELVDRLREHGRVAFLDDGTANSWSTEALRLLLSSGGGSIDYDNLR